MVTVSDVKNPRWDDETSTTILVDVLLVGNPSGVYEPMAANATDPYTQGIFDNALAGEYGPIAAYEPPPSPDE